MTNEEVIRIIKIVLAIAEDFEITVQGEELTEEKCKEAVEIVTKALEQQPKPGHWIVIREEYEFMGGTVNEPRGCKCSNCNKVVRFRSDFCPNCGAYMAESEDKE